MNALNSGSGKCVTGMIWQVVGKFCGMIGCRISVLSTPSVLVLEDVVAEVSLCWRLLFDVGIKFTDWLISPQGELKHICLVSRSAWYGQGISGLSDNVFSSVSSGYP